MFTKKHLIVALILILVTAVATVLAFELNSKFLKTDSVTLTDNINVMAQVCQPLPNQTPEIAYLEPTCSTISWNPIVSVSGYPNCEFTNDRYKIEISEDSNFENIDAESNWISGYTYNPPNLNGNTIYNFRITATDLNNTVESQKSTAISCQTTEQIGKGIKQNTRKYGYYKKWRSKFFDYFEKPVISQLNFRQSALDTACPKRPNKDIVYNDTSNHPRYSIIQDATLAGIVKGYPDKYFMPDQNITRAEATKITVLSLCENLNMNPEIFTKFSDVNEKDWHFEYIVKLATHGYVIGYSDGEFKPEQKITKAEALKILTLAIISNTSASLSLEPYIDYLNVTKKDWYYTFINFAIYYELIDYNLKGFNPQENITRAEFLDLINQFFKLSNKLQAI
jgi:hypothetical protein